MRKELLTIFLGASLLSGCNIQEDYSKLPNYITGFSEVDYITRGRYGLDIINELIFREGFLERIFNKEKETE